MAYSAFTVRLLFVAACASTTLAGCSGADADRAERSGPSGTSGSGAAGGTDNTTGSGATGAGGIAGSSGTAGSTSSGGASGTGATGGTDSADSGALHFEWPDTEPGTGQCKPGLYEGTFQCTYTDPSGGGAIPVSGPISIRLVESTSGEFLEVRDGVLDGTANTFFTFRADVEGKLDCYRGSFTGKLINGTYSGFLIVNGSFEGPLAASYDHQGVALTSGTWQLNVAISGGGCNGTWSATYVGP